MENAAEFSLESGDFVSRRVPLELSRFFRDFSRFSIRNKSCILQCENEINSRETRFLTKFLTNRVF